MWNFIYRLAFTKDDDVDLSQVFLWTYNIFFIVWISMVGSGIWTISEPMVNAFLIVYATTVLLSSPSWLIKMWIEKGNSWFIRPPITPVTATTDMQELGGDLPASPVHVPPTTPWIG